MALQIRRGTDVDRQGITPKAGEPIFTTDTKKLYIGDGTTAGGIIVDTTSGISNVIEDTTPQLGGNLDINNFDITGTGDISITGQISATSMDLKGSIFADDSTLLVDGVSGTIPASNLTGSATIDITGDVVGDVTGSLDGTMTGSVFSDGSSLLVDGINSKVVGDVDTSSVITNFLNLKTTDSTAAEMILTYDAGDAVDSTVLNSVKFREGSTERGLIQARRNNIYLSAGVGDSAKGITFYNTYAVTGGVSLRIDPTNTLFTAPTNALEVNGTASANAFAGPLTGDVTGSVYADNSTQIIDGVAGEIVSLTFRGETGNTPADTGTVDSWLEVSVNGATKYIPLYD